MTGTITAQTIDRMEKDREELERLRIAVRAVTPSLEVLVERSLEKWPYRTEVFPTEFEDIKRFLENIKSKE